MATPNLKPLDRESQTVPTDPAGRSPLAAFDLSSLLPSTVGLLASFGDEKTDAQRDSDQDHPAST